MTATFGGDGGSCTRVATLRPLILLPCSDRCSIRHQVDNGRKILMTMFRNYAITTLNGSLSARRNDTRDQTSRSRPDGWPPRLGDGRNKRRLSKRFRDRSPEFAHECVGTYESLSTLTTALRVSAWYE